MSSNINTNITNSSLKNNININISLLTLDEFGFFLCNTISLYGHRCAYTIGKNIHCASHAILFIDGKMYTYTHLLSHLENGVKTPCRIWEAVEVYHFPFSIVRFMVKVSHINLSLKLYIIR